MRKYRQPKKAYLKVSTPFWEVGDYLLFKILIAFTSVLAFLQVFYYHEHPMSVLKYKYEIFVFAVGAIIIAWGVIQLLVCKWISGSYGNFFSPGAIICIIFTGIVFVFFTYSMITMSGRLGIVSINSAQDMKYIERYRHGDYKLNVDIDAAELEKIWIGDFAGTLDGQGKSINNLKTADKSFIRNNSGTITNIVFQTPNLSAPIFEKNSGTINMIAVNSPEIAFTDLEVFGVISKTSAKKAVISNCVVNDIRLNSQTASLDLSGDTELPECEVFGGICGENKGKIISCKVVGITGGAMENKYFGGISGKNGTRRTKAVIKDSHATNINLYVRCSESFGGISGEGYANYIACATGGAVNFVAGTDANFGGITGTLKLGGNIKNSYNNINFTTTSSHFNIGGIAGILYGSCVVEKSHNNGSITTVVSAANDNDDIYIGGVVGTAVENKCIIRNVLNTGSIVLDTTNYSSEIPNSFQSKYNIFVVAGIYGATERKLEDDFESLSIENSYSAGSVIGVGKEVSYMGGIQSPTIGFIADVKNCFFAGQISKPESMSNAYCTISGQVNANNYYSTNSGYSPSNPDADKAVDAWNFMDPNFITNMLGWDATIWNVAGGTYPTLQAYTMENETDEDSKDREVKEAKDENKEDSDDIIWQIILVAAIVGSAIFWGVISSLGGGSPRDEINIDDYTDLPGYDADLVDCD